MCCKRIGRHVGRIGIADSPRLRIEGTEVAQIFGKRFDGNVGCHGFEAFTTRTATSNECDGECERSKDGDIKEDGVARKKGSENGFFFAHGVMPDFECSVWCVTEDFEEGVVEFFSAGDGDNEFFNFVVTVVFGEPGDEMCTFGVGEIDDGASFSEGSFDAREIEE